MSGDHEPSVVVLAENAVDFKYSRITRDLDLEYRRVDVVRFAAALWLGGWKRRHVGKQVFFHVRYLKWRGFILTIPVYLLLIVGCRLRGIGITWSCHNIWEHKFRSRTQNAILRHVMSRAAERIVVFHPSVARFLPNAAREKIAVANFGDFRVAISKRTKVDNSLRTLLSDWKRTAGIRGPDLLLVSASIEDVEGVLASIRRLRRHTALAVLPNHDCTEMTDSYLIYAGYISGTLHQLLSGEQEVVGLVPHDNISVPTSLYSFASYSRPMIARDAPPLSEVMHEWGMGVLFGLEDSLDAKLDRVKSDYRRFSLNCERFIRANSWGKAAEVHREIWRDDL